MRPMTNQAARVGQKRRRTAKVKSQSARRVEQTCWDPAVSGRELRDLLAPVTPETFTALYWGRHPLFIKGQPEKLQRLLPGGFGREDFYQAVRQAAASRVKGYHLFAGKHQGLDPALQGCDRPFDLIEPDQMEAMFAAGANVGAENIYDQRLAAFAAALKTQLQHPGEIRLFATLSPEGQGFPPHVDRSSGIFIQCEGAKRYRISSGPIFPWPRGSALIFGNGTGEYFDHEAEDWEAIEGVETGNFTEVVMEPGDLLIIPPGTIHATEAVGGPCLNLNLLFVHQNFFDLVNRVLEDQLISNPNWRYLPAISAAGVKPGELPTEALEFFAERLAELGEAVKALTPAAFALNRQWHKLIADPGEAVRASLPPSPAEPNRQPVRRRDVLSLSRQAPMTYAAGTDDDGTACLYLYFKDKEVSVAGAWVPFLQRMLEQRQFIAESATKWAEQTKRYPWKEVQEYLQVLLDEGFLQRPAKSSVKRISASNGFGGDHPQGFAAPAMTACAQID